MTSKSLLVTQLNSLLRLTHTETLIAQTRRAQAASDVIERELAANADKGKERAQLLTDAIKDLGSLPDVVGVAVGRVSAAVKASTEQGQDLTDALLGDLALEHDLLDRTRLARMIAEQLKETKTLKVLDRLEDAHTATIDWLMTRLAEVAVGGPTALRTTTMQSLAGVSRRATQFPVQQAATTLNRSADIVGRVQQRTVEAVTTNVERARELAAAAGDIWTAGRDATLKRTEQVAEQRGARATARNVNSTRRGLGAVDASELPIRGYDALNAGTAIARIGRLSDADDVRTILAYETANKHRKGVSAAARDQLEQVAAQLAAAS
jgi:bacterioferritin (cytochrome b1)